jgi:hypothetical protein
MSKLEKDARWYVYALSDPRDGAVFYVGKGCGNRMHQHEREAARPTTRCSRKIDRIRSIVADGAEVQKQMLARFWDEQAAYDHETDLIDEIGLANLTNVLPGGQKAWERRKQERQSRKTDWTPMEAAKVIASRNAWSGLALWMRVDAGHSFEMKGPRLTVMVWEAAVRALFPRMWARIEQSREAVEFCRPYLARQGVRLAYDGA